MDVPFEKDILEKYSIHSLSTKQRKIFYTVINNLRINVTSLMDLEVVEKVTYFNNYLYKPSKINDESTCNISPNFEYGIKLRNVKVIIWDEITMTSKHAFEAVDKLFRDICENNEILCGKLILVSGDFRQTLPIVKPGNRTQVVENCVKNRKLRCNF